MKFCRCDRKKRIRDYNVHITGGGVCIFVLDKWIKFTITIAVFSTITLNYEIVTVTITHPKFRKFVIACVYKPPKGKVENCIKFMKDLVVYYQNLDFEIWILGDFNTDILRRDDVHTVQLTRFTKQMGLTQLINGITRSNKKGGSCIDLIMSDCLYIQERGILDDLLADYYSVYSIREKKEETKEKKTKNGHRLYKL